MPISQSGNKTVRTTFKHSCGTEGTIYHRVNDEYVATLTINAHRGLASDVGNVYAASFTMLEMVDKYLSSGEGRADLIALVNSLKETTQ